jgi:DNA-binding response OmpR family regulator
MNPLPKRKRWSITEDRIQLLAARLREIWGPKSEEHRQYLRVYITHLRQKIEPDPEKSRLIRTEPGIGYRFAVSTKET